MSLDKRAPHPGQGGRAHGVPAGEPGPQSIPRAGRVEPLAVGRRGAAGLCGVSVRSWDRAVSSGLAPRPVRIGGRVLWVVAELRAWLECGCPPRERWRP